MDSLKYIVSVAVLIVYTTTTSSLHITHLSVPRRVALGDAAKLECDWDNNNQTIYSLKWYYNLKEFYRWTPAERNEQVQVFDISEFKVDKRESDRGRVVLRNLNRRADGNMRCEISGEAPSFQTTAKIQHMEVVELPRQAPILSPVYDSYQLHQEVAINCSSRHSKPPASLSLFVNNEPVNHNWITRNFTERDGHNKGFPLYKSTKEIRFRVVPSLLNEQDKVSVKCVAEIPDVYWQTHEVNLALDLPQRASIMEGRASAGCPLCRQFSLMAPSLALLILWNLNLRH